MFSIKYSYNVALLSGNIIFSFCLSLSLFFLTESTVMFSNFASVLVSNPDIYKQQYQKSCSGKLGHRLYMYLRKFG